MSLVCCLPTKTSDGHRLYLQFENISSPSVVATTDKEALLNVIPDDYLIVWRVLITVPRFPQEGLTVTVVVTGT